MTWKDTLIMEEMPSHLILRIAHRSCVEPPALIDADHVVKKAGKNERTSSAQYVGTSGTPG